MSSNTLFSKKATINKNARIFLRLLSVSPMRQSPQPNGKKSEHLYIWAHAALILLFLRLHLYQDKHTPKNQRPNLGVKINDFIGVKI